MVSDAARPGTHSGSRGELADLLRSRRDRLTPADMGLPAGTRRRTAGLRREEVAQLAGVSTTYYTFLDQAKAETVASVVSAMIARLDPFPAYLKGRRWDVLAANRTARALFTDWSVRPPGDRNLVWWMFTDPQARKVYVHWEKEASDMLGRFRAAAGRRPDDPDFTELIERLHQASPEVRSWWPRYDVRPVGGGTKHLHHPDLGDVAFQHTVLQVADQPEQMLVYFSTDEVPAAKLAALAGGLG